MEKAVLKVKFEHLNFFRFCEEQGDAVATRWGKCWYKMGFI